MTERAFVDTNVLFYAEDLDAGPKRARARNLRRDALTAHVLRSSEFSVAESNSVSR